MRQRILLSVLGVLVAALVAFAVPLAIAVRGVLIDRALDELQAQLEQVALVVDSEARTCGFVQLFVGRLAQGETELSLWTTDGQLVAASGGEIRTLGDELDVAADGRLGRSYVEDRLAVATALSTRVCGPRLLLRASVPSTSLTTQVRGVWLGLGLVGIAVLALAAAAATWQGRRLAAPLEDLASSARRLGEGDFTARAPRSGLPEPDAIAAALDTTAERLGRAAQRASAFTADASHQLRTPLTALRLQLEAMAVDGAPSAAIEAALEEADRLEATIDELVALTRVEGTEEALDLASVVASRLAPWRALAAERGRSLDVQVLPTPPVRARPAAVGQALQVLLDNAFVHGTGTVTVRVSPSLPGGVIGPGGARICVADEGSGVPPEVVERRVGRDRGGGPLPVTGGRGLVLARSLIEAEGGRLVVEPGARVCLLLPGAQVADAGGRPSEGA